MSVSALILSSLLLVGIGRAEVPPDAHYIRGSVVNVRARPDATATVLFRLRINSHVGVVTESRGWSAVVWSDPTSAVGRTSERQGYVRSHLVGRHEVGLRDALARARAASRAGQTQRAVVWAERAFAVDGLSPQARDLLVAVYDGAGRHVSALRLTRWLEGRTRAFLAVCRQGHAEVLAQVDPARGLVAVDPTQSSGPSPLLRDLGGLAWFALGADGPHYVPGARFAVPQSAATHRLPAASGAPGGEERRVILGPCGQDETVYATAPLARVERTLLEREPALSVLTEIRRATGLSGSHCASVRIKRSALTRFGEPDGWDAWLEVSCLPPRHSETFFTFWALLDASGEQVLATLGSMNPAEYASVVGVYWARLGASRVGVAIVDTWGERTQGNTHARVVRVDAQGRWQSLPVALVGSSTDRGGSLPAPARRRSLKLKDHLIRTGLWLVVAATVAGWVLGFASQTGRRRVGRVLTGLSALAFSAGALRLSVFGGNASWLGRAVVLAAVVVVACLAFASWLVLLAQFALPALSAWTLRRARERNRRANP